LSTSVPPNRAELRFRSIVDRLGAIVFEAIPTDTPGEAVFTFVSEGTEALLGYPAERWTSDPGFWLAVTHPDDRETVLEGLRTGLAGSSSADLEFRLVAADGRHVWVHANVHADRDDGRDIRLRGVLVDVTERRAAERRLRRLQQLTDALSGMLDARQAAAVVATQGRAAVEATAVAVFLREGDELELSGYDGYPGEAIEEFCRIPLDRDVPAAEAARTGEAIVLDADAFDERYPGGTLRKLAGRGQFVALPLRLDGSTLGSLAIRMPADRPVGSADRVVLDVLARTCAQALQRAAHVAAERAANAVLDTIITTAPEGFALFDTDLRYVRVNDALARINGVPAAAHAGRRLREVVPDLPSEHHEALLRQVLETGEPIVDVEFTGSTAADPDRRSTWLVSYYPVRGGDGRIEALGAFVLDITARKRGEQRAQILAGLAPILDEVVGVEERLARLADAMVPDVADACTVFLRSARGELRRVAGRHVDPDAEAILAALGDEETADRERLGLRSVTTRSLS
jgi:PAS domain S-box-containing protein